MGLGNFLGFGRKSEKVDVESSSSPTGKTSIKDPLSSSKTKTEANNTPIQQPNSNTEEDPLTPDTTSLNPTSLPSDHLHTHINLSLPHPHLHPHPPSYSPSSSPTNQEVPPPPRENPQQWTPRQTQKELHLQKQNTKTIGDILTSISIEDFKHVHEAPCVREALLAGIGVGAGGGGVKFVFGASIPKAANWAAGLFCATSLIVHETCQYRKYRERANMQKAIEIMERRRAERVRKRSGDGGGAGDGGTGKENVGSASPSGSNNGDTSTEQNGENKKSWYKFW